MGARPAAGEGDLRIGHRTERWPKFWWFLDVFGCFWPQVLANFCWLDGEMMAKYVEVLRPDLLDRLDLVKNGTRNCFGSNWMGQTGGIFRFFSDLDWIRTGRGPWSAWQRHLRLDLSGIES